MIPSSWDYSIRPAQFQMGNVLWVNGYSLVDTTEPVIIEYTAASGGKILLRISVDFAGRKLTYGNGSSSKESADKLSELYLDLRVLFTPSGLELFIGSCVRFLGRTHLLPHRKRVAMIGIYSELCQYRSSQACGQTI